MPMQDSTNAALNERNCTIGNNFAATPASHKSQLPMMLLSKLSFITYWRLWFWPVLNSYHFSPNLGVFFFEVLKFCHAILFITYYPVTIRILHGI